MIITIAGLVSLSFGVYNRDKMGSSSGGSGGVYRFNGTWNGGMEWWNVG